MITRLLVILRRRWPILLLLPLLGAGLGLLSSSRSEAQGSSSYRAKAVVTVDRARVTPAQVRQDVVEAEGGEVAEKAALALGTDTLSDDVRSRISPRFDKDTYVLVFTGSGSGPVDGEAVAEVFAKLFVTMGNADVDGTQQAEVLTAQSDRDAAQAALDDFVLVNAEALAAPSPPQALVDQRQVLETTVAATQTSLDEERTIQRTNDIYAFVEVTRETRSMSASLAIRVSLGLIVGLVGAGVLIAVVERRHRRQDDPECHRRAPSGSHRW